MSEHVPHMTNPADPTFTVGATPVVGGQLVEISAGMTIIPAGASSTKVVGVACRDAAVGAQVMLFTGGIHDLVATGAIAAGDLVVAAAAGTVASIAAVGAYNGNERAIIGVAYEAIANAAKGRIKLKNV